MTLPLRRGTWSPDVGNLMLGRGVILLQPEGDTAFYDVGNAPAVSITPKIDTLEHYDSQTSSFARNALFATKKSIEAKISLEELTLKNMAMLFSGSIDETDPTHPIVNLMTNENITAHFKYFGTNSRGPRYYADIPSMTFVPSGDFSPITENKLATMEITGSVNYLNGVWGSITLQPPVATIAPENFYAPFITTDNACAVGDTLEVEVGHWAGVGITFTYLWKVGGTTPGGTSINGTTYVPVVADEGKTVTCDVVATNVNGNLTVTTAAVGPVTAY